VGAGAADWNTAGFMSSRTTSGKRGLHWAEDCVGGIVRREAAQFLDDFFEFAVFLGLARRSLVSQVDGWSNDGDGRNHLYRVVQ
jgi:hypothetical protein